jgi:hypothetical protein
MTQKLMRLRLDSVSYDCDCSCCVAMAGSVNRYHFEPRGPTRTGAQPIRRRFVGESDYGLHYMSCRPTSRLRTREHALCLPDVTSNRVSSPCGQMLLHLSYGLAAGYRNPKSVRCFSWFNPHHFPRACECDRARDRSAAHRDGELNRSAIRNQASGFQKQATVANVSSDSINLSQCVPGREPHLDEVLEIETTEFPFLYSVHR